MVRITRKEAKRLGLELPPAKRKTAPKTTFPPEASKSTPSEPGGSIRLRLPWPPSINHYWRNWKGKMVLSEAGRRYRTEAGIEILRAGIRKPLDGLLAVRLTCVFPNKMRRDLDNLPKAILDALAKGSHPAYHDDSQIKLLIVEQSLTIKPGWIDVCIGPKPNADQQQNLFTTDW